MAQKMFSDNPSPQDAIYVLWRMISPPRIVCSYRQAGGAGGQFHLSKDDPREKALHERSDWIDWVGYSNYQVCESHLQGFEVPGVPAQASSTTASPSSAPIAVPHIQPATRASSSQLYPPPKVAPTSSNGVLQPSMRVPRQTAVTIGTVEVNRNRYMVHGRALMTSGKIRDQYYRYFSTFLTQGNELKFVKSIPSPWTVVKDPTEVSRLCERHCVAKKSVVQFEYLQGFPKGFEMHRCKFLTQHPQFGRRYSDYHVVQASCSTENCPNAIWTVQ